MYCYTKHHWMNWEKNTQGCVTYYAATLYVPNRPNTHPVRPILQGKKVEHIIFDLPKQEYTTPTMTNSQVAASFIHSFCHNRRKQ